MKSENRSKQINKSKAPPSERNREGTVCKLVQAATKVFGKWGYDGATTKMVAVKAGINEALITRYFGGKSGLVLAVILESIKKQQDLEKDLEPPTSVEAEILRIVAKMRDHHGKNRDFMRILISRAAFDPKMNREIHKSLSIYGSPVFRARLHALQEQGKIREGVNLDDVTFAIWLYCMGNIMMLYVMPPDLDMVRMDKAAAIFAHEMAASLKAKA